MLLKQEITLEVTPEAINYIAVQGFDPQFGARPIKRLIQREVLNKLSKEILTGQVKPGDPVVLDAFDDQVVFRAPIKPAKESTLER